MEGNILMDVLFFPFSHVDETQRTTLAAFFPRFIFMPLAADLAQSPAMVPLVEHHAAVPVFTPRARLDEVAPLVNAWMNWAAMHQGNTTNLKTLVRDTPYLTEHLGPAPIASELRARIAGTGPRDAGASSLKSDSQKSDPLLFSIIARLTDAQNEGIDQAMAGLEQKRRSLFSQLRGEAEPLDSRDAGPAGHSGRDPGDVLTRERVRAWAACAREAHLFSGQGPWILVTTSAAVFDLVSANASRVRNALDIEAIKVHEGDCDNQLEWQKQVLALFEALATGPVDPDRAMKMLDFPEDSCAMTGRIQVQVVEGPDLEKRLNLPDQPLLVCRVSLTSY